MKLLWLGYLVYSFGNCVMKLCIETGLKVQFFHQNKKMQTSSSTLSILNCKSF